MKIFSRLQAENGMATFIALMVMLMMTVMGLAALKLAEDEISIAGNEMNEMTAFYASEAGLERAAAVIQDQYESTGAPPTVLPAGSESINSDVIATYTTTDLGAAVQRTLTQGSLAGLKAQVKTYRIESIGTSLVDGGQIRLTQDFESANVPIFQWAVFYADELWVEPVFDMNINGRVHANKDMYIRCAGSGKVFLFEDKVTCAGDIIHGFPWVGSKGDVRFTNNQGTAVSMNQGGTWIDSKHPKWYDTASVLWGGMVRDKAFGEEELNLPLAGGDPHKMIERAGGSNTDSYENKAGLKIIDGVPYSKIGSVWQDISAFLPSGTINLGSSVSFFDAKEKKQVRNTEIDIGKLVTSGYYPSNGIIYVSDQTAASSTYGLNGTSLINGDDLNGKPMTIACENPIYIQGDFNTNDKVPSSVFCDAITLLSDNWDYNKAQEKDSYGRLYSDYSSDVHYSKRIPSATEVNLSFLTGDVAADISAKNHGGGLENLPRFLENWSGREMKIRGSMIQMWKSRQATGTYTYKKYYTAPSRNWGFDTDLEDPSKLPPGTPCVRIFQRTSWSQQDVGYSSR